MSEKKTQDDWNEELIFARAKHTALATVLFVMVFVSGWFLGRWEMRSVMSYTDTMVIGGTVYDISEK